MDLKIYNLERNPRLWLDGWQSLETFLQIISMTSISVLEQGFFIKTIQKIAQHARLRYSTKRSIQS